MSELRVTTLKHESATADNITLASNGNVGIGTSSPASALSFGAVFGKTLAVFENAGGNNIYGIGMTGVGTVSDPFRTRLFSNGFEYLSVDSAGRVTMPYQPSFAASLTNGNTTGNSADIAFNFVRHNIGNHYNSGSGYFTAPVAGVYSFNISVMSQTVTQNNVHYLIKLNGADLQHSYSSSGGGIHHKWNWNGHIALNANDTININTGGFQMYGGNALYSWFSGHLLG